MGGPQADPAPLDPALIAGRTAWRVEQAERVAVLVDAAAYFEAFARAVVRARRSVRVVGWDVDSQVELLRRGRSGDAPTRLAPLLEWALRRRPELEIHVLIWDYSVIFALEREAMPRLSMGALTHPRLHFRLDGDHPVGGSQHQKVVVVDDRLAFVGGIDLGRRRWDTSRHRAADPERITPSGLRYPPNHDVQAMVAGDAARALGDLARERWRRATGERLAPVRVEHDPWPEDVGATLRDVAVGVIRTEPAHAGRPEVRETEAFLLRAIEAARDVLYVENQYLTASSVGAALEGRLRDPHGPEVILLLPGTNEGWLERSTMGAMRARIVTALRRADPGGRLRVVCPRVAGAEPPSVHAKLLIADDRLLYVGSANLAHRSMWLDSEAGIGVDAAGGAELALGLRMLRARLLAHHLGTSHRAVLGAVERTGSWIGALDTLRGGPHSLEPLVVDELEWPEALGQVADLERPIDLWDWIDEIVS